MAGGPMTREEILALPVSSVRDGWTLGCGCVYLHMEVKPKHQVTAVLPTDRTRADHCRIYHHG